MLKTINKGVKMNFHNFLEKYSINNKMVGCYEWGSLLWKTMDGHSDLDFVVIIDSSKDIFENYTFENVYNGNTFKTDIILLSNRTFEGLLWEHDEMAMALYFSSGLMNYNPSYFKLDLSKLRKSFSKKYNNSFVKAKKKYIVEYPKYHSEIELRKSYKSLFHCIRILKFGIALAKYKDDFEMDKFIYHLKDDYKMVKLIYENNKEWEDIVATFKKVFKYNEMASEFRRLAPKK